LLGRDALLFRRLLDLLAMLVDARKKIHRLALQALETRHHVRQQLFVGVPQVRRPIYVIDGGGDVIRLHARAGQ